MFRFSVSVCVLVVCLCAKPALASNEDSFLYGDHASLMGGAVLSTISGTGATWYNPAGLGQNMRSKLELSATAFTLRHRRIPTGLRVTLPGEEVDQAIRSKQIFIVPSSIAWVRQLSDRLSLGLGIFATEQDVFRFDGEINRGPDSPGMELDMVGQLSGAIFRYHGGASIGWQAASGLRLGASLFAIYETHDEFRKLFAKSATEGTYQTTFLQRLVDAEVSRFSVQAVLGLQFEVGDYWHFGAVIRSPRWTWVEAASTDNSTAVVSTSNTLATVTVTNVDHQLLNSSGTGLTKPPRFYLGAARRTPDYELAIEMDVRPPVFNEIHAARWAVNGRAGLLLRLNNTNQLGIGLFSDQYSQDVPRSFPDFRVDYYGTTVGWKRKSIVNLRESEEAPTLVFSTTIAVRYAMGFGESTTIRFDYTDTADTGLIGRIDDARVDVLYHEFSLYLGTALEF